MTNRIGPGWSLERGKETDFDAVLPLVRAFYQHFGFPWNEVRKLEILREILRSPQVGCLWVIRDSEQVVGYALVIFFLSLEFDGRVGVLDEFFLNAAQRGKGFGSWVFNQLKVVLLDEGIRVLRLEVDARHPEATDLYRRHGLQREPREVWSTRLPSERPRDSGSVEPTA